MIFQTPDSGVFLFYMICVFFACLTFAICSMIGLRKERNMQRFVVCLAVFMVSIDVFAGANLPVVDVSNGTISARAVFGEEIIQPQRVAVEPLSKNTKNKVVARTNKQTKQSGFASDVLKPMRPSSDLWANNDAPLRMPRIDEIAVLRSDASLPEETLSIKPTRVAQNKQSVAIRESKAELDALRDEIARLNELKKQTEQNIAMVRDSLPSKLNLTRAVSETSTESRGVNVRREIVPMETTHDVVMRSVAKKDSEPKIVSANKKMLNMSPNELKKAFKKTYLSENKHLSTYQIDDRYDVTSDMTSEVEGFSAQRDLSEMDSGVRPLEIKISFLDNDAGLSRDNYTLISETASIVVNNPKRAIQIAIPESVTYNKDSRKLAARRLAIVEQVLRDTGVADQRIVPVLSQRGDDVFVLRIISGDTFETLTQQKRNMFGESVSKKTYKSMSW